MEVFLLIGGISVLSLVLFKAAEEIVSSVHKISNVTGIATFALASVLISLSTSTPELFVGINSALHGVPVLSLGNIIGSNIANVSLVLGLAGLLGGSILVKSHAGLNREFVISFFGGLLPFVLLWDRNLSRLDGVVLLVFYLTYVLGLFHGKLFGGKEKKNDCTLWECLIKGFLSYRPVLRGAIFRFVIAVLVVIAASYLLVRLATSLSEVLHLPVFLLGLLLISVGTTMPELALSFRSIRDGEPNILLGNRLGAIVANATFVLGIVALISPFTIPLRREYLLSVGAFILSFLIFWVLAWTRGKISRGEAFALLVVYFVFVVLEVLGFRLV